MSGEDENKDIKEKNGLETFNSCLYRFVTSPALSFRELDTAMLRRLEKRILVNLPSAPARQAMISHWLPPLNSTRGVELRTELDYETLAKVCDTFSLIKFFLVTNMRIVVFGISLKKLKIKRENARSQYSERI